MKCFFTDTEVNLINSEKECMSYIVNGIQINVVNRDVDVCKMTFNSKTYINNKHVFKSIILNGKWPLKNDEWIESEEDLQKILKEVVYPKNPKEKLDKLLLYLNDLQTHEGEEFNMFKYFTKNEFANQLYFKNRDELNYYLKTLHESNLINAIFSDGGIGYCARFNFTFEGIIKAIELQEEGKHSNNCFIAMSFNNAEEIKGIRNAIKEVVEDLNFSAKIVDEVHFDSDKTINDAIVALIKQSKFAICDFTEQKDGVYFEAGYAAGRGMPVIYTCRKDWFDGEKEMRSHFDTNHFPHIIYETTEELKEKLKNKIEAWIL